MGIQLEPGGVVPARLASLLVDRGLPSRCGGKAWLGAGLSSGPWDDRSVGFLQFKPPWEQGGPTDAERRWSEPSCAFDVTVENQTPVALLIRLQGSDVVISWPVPCDGTYLLERTIGLVPPIDWAPVLEPAVPVGDRLQVTTLASGQLRFLRLRKL